MINLKLKKKKKFWQKIRLKTKNKKTVTKKDQMNSMALKGIMPGLVVSYAGCCYPVPGDRILGAVHAGKGVSIHRSTCVNIKRLWDQIM